MKLIYAEGLERKFIGAKNVSKLEFLLRAEQKLFRLVGEGEALCYQHIFVYCHVGEHCCVVNTQYSKYELC